MQYAELPASPTVYVVDDDPGVLAATARLLRSHGLPVQTHSSGQAFLAEVTVSAVGCAVMDFSMPGMDGIAVQEALCDRGSLLGVVFLTGHADLTIGVKAMKSGAIDFLTKPVDELQLVGAISRASERSLAAHAAARQREGVLTRVSTLTPREREVMDLVVTGALNKQVADRLGTAEKTVKVHRARVMEKMQVRSLAELVRILERADIATDTP